MYNLYKTVAAALLAVAGTLLSLPIAATHAHASAPGASPIPRRIVLGPGIDHAPALASDHDGRVSLAWMRTEPDQSKASVMLARPPAWMPISLTPISPLAAPRAQIAVNTQADTVLAYAYAVTGTTQIALHGLGQQEAMQRFEITDALHTALYLGSHGDLHTLHATPRDLAYRHGDRAISVSLPDAPRLQVQQVALAVDGQGQAHAAWWARASGSAAASLYYSPVITDAEPVHLGAGSNVMLQVDGRNIVHLVWHSEGALHHASSSDWEHVAHVADVAQPPLAAMSVGHDGTVHVVWIEAGTLWHSTSVDWQLARRKLLEVRDVADVTLAVDPYGQAHIAWIARTADGLTELYYLPAWPASAQIRLAYPRADETVSGATKLLLETNLLPDGLLRAEFFVQPDVAQLAMVPEAWIAVGIDYRGDDGWGVSLIMPQLLPGRYRAMAIGTLRDGTLIRTTGPWFLWEPTPGPGLWLQSADNGLSTGTGGLAAFASDTKTLAQASTQALDIYLAPPWCDPRGTACLEPGLPRASLTQYLGHYDGRRTTFSFDSLRVPDGLYYPLLQASSFSTSASIQPIQIDNALPPRLQVTTPEAGPLQRGFVQASATAWDMDGTIARVDFYLERAFPVIDLADGLVTVPHRFWLGSDTDGTDGYQIRKRAPEDWDGSGWTVYAVAYDQQGLATDARSPGTFDILSRPRPHLEIARPRTDFPLHGIEQITISTGQGAPPAKSVAVYAQNSAGQTLALGEMISSASYWSLDWDTRQFTDGQYTLLFIGEQDNGPPVTFQSELYSVRNGPATYVLKRPPRGEVLSGTMLIQVQEISPTVPLVSAHFLCRDGEGELLYLGEDSSPDQGWGFAWPTATLLDGDYTLVVMLNNDTGQPVIIEREISIWNRAPTIALSIAPDPVWEGSRRITWQATHPLSLPMSVSIAYSPDGGQRWMAVAENMRSDGSYLWDTTSYPDAPDARLRLTVSDGLRSGHTVSDPFRMDNRNERPRVALLSPQPRSVHGVSELPLAWRAWDPDDDALQVVLEYRLEDGEWQLLADDLGPEGILVWQPDQVPELEHLFASRRAGLSIPTPITLACRLTATDYWGARATQTVENVTLVINHAPKVTLIWPDGGIRVDNEAFILWQATDPDNDPLLIDLYYSDNAGQAWLPLATGLPNSGYYGWQVSFLPAGQQYRVRVVARDQTSSSQDESAETFSIGQATRQLLTLLSPAGGSVLMGQQWVRWATLAQSETQRATLSVRRSNAPEWQIVSDGENTGSLLWDTRAWANGSFDLRLTVSDALTQISATTATPVIVANGENVPPAVTLLAPLGGERWSGVREIRWAASDPDSPVLTATLSLSADGGVTWQELAVVDAREGRYVWDTRPLGGNNHLVRVVVTDGITTARALSHAPFAVVHQYGHPPDVHVFSPNQEGTLLRGDIIAWVASDADNDPLRVTLLLSDGEGLAWRTLARDLASAGQFSMAEVAEIGRTYRVQVVASDGIFHTAHWSAPFRLAPRQGALPEITVTGPTQPANWAGEGVVRWQVAVNAASVSQIRIEASGDGAQTWQVIAQDAPNTGAYTWDTTRVPNGTYRLRVVAVNPFGQSAAQSAPITIRNADGDPATISIVTPRVTGTWSGLQEIVWHITGAEGHVISVNLAYSIDRGATWRAIARGVRGTDRYVWDTTTAPNCSEVWLRAELNTGNWQRQVHSQAPVAIYNLAGPVVKLNVIPPGHTWQGRQVLEWHTAGQFDRPLRVAIEYSQDGGRTWRLLADDQPPQGRFVWDTLGLLANAPLAVRARTSDRGQMGLDTLWSPFRVRERSPAATVPFRP